MDAKYAKPGAYHIVLLNSMLSPETLKILANSLPTILTIKEVASILHCSEITIRRVIWEKQLPAFLADGQWNILRSDLIRYLDEHSN